MSTATKSESDEAFAPTSAKSITQVLSVSLKHLPLSLQAIMSNWVVLSAQ